MPCVLIRNPRQSWNPIIGEGRMASLLRFVMAAAWFKFALILAATAAQGLSQFAPTGDFFELIDRILLLFLLLLGYGYMGLAFDRQPKPLDAMGLQRRSGCQREFGIGAALGWALVVVIVLLISILGELRIDFWTEPRAFWLFGINLAVLAVASLAEEVAFRGYAFQRLIAAVGPTMATIIMACLFGLEHATNPDATGTTLLVTMIAGILFSIAYLRTRALWLPWGLHFAWNVSMGVLFGLPLSGVINFATLVQGRALGRRWLTGGSYGPEGSTVTALVLIAGIIVLVRVTREYAWKYAQPVIVAGGMAVEIAPPAAHTAMETSAAEPKPSPLVQIGTPASQQLPLPTRLAGNGSADTGGESD